jgi:isochorismate hydrolase
MIKKEKYFDKKNIAKQAGKWINSIKWKKKPTLAELDFNRAALLVLDMQSYFVEQNSHAFIPSAAAIVPNIVRLQEYFLNNNQLVVQTKHINTADNAGRMKDWWGQLMTRDNPRTEILPELKDKQAMVMEKSQYDAFYQTDLAHVLLEKNIETLFITGVMTHLCVETTARSAFVRGFEVFLVVDGTATYTRRFFKSSLINLSHGFVYPIQAQEILTLLEG